MSNKMNKLNAYGVNAAIKSHILSDEEMRNAGFVDSMAYWRYHCRLDCEDAIDFYMDIIKYNGDVRIGVCDAVIGEPYRYKHVLKYHPQDKFALGIQEKVEEQMAYLQKCGVISGHEYGEYIF